MLPGGLVTPLRTSRCGGLSVSRDKGAGSDGFWRPTSNVYRSGMTTELPRFEMLWPLLEVVKERGGSASIQEIEEGVAEKIGLTEEQLDVLHGGGPRTEISYRLAWCRTYLKYVGALENSARGVWAITEEGRGM